MGLLGDVFSGGDTPDAPKLKKEKQGLREWADEFLKPLYNEQLTFARDYIDQYGDLNQQILQRTMPAMEQMFDAYLTDRNRYEQTFVPLQDQIIQYAQGYDTPERREEEAARRISEVSQSFQAERDNAQRRLESYGVDPSQTRQAALDRDIRAQEAMAQAQAGNQGRLDVESRGQGLMHAAQQMGQNLPGQALASGQLATGVGQSALSGTTAGAAAGGGLMAQPVNTAAQASKNIYNIGGLKLGQFGAETGEYGMERQQTGDIWSGVGGLVDMGSSMMGFFADGGYVDKYAAMGMSTGGLDSFGSDMFNLLPRTGNSEKDRAVNDVRDPYAIEPVSTQNYESALGIADPNAMGTGADALGVTQMTSMLPFADGGEAVTDAQGIQAENADRVPALLSHGEYVIPADVVRAKGTEFFDKLSEKYHTPSEQQGAQAQMSTRGNLNGGIPQLRDGGMYGSTASHSGTTQPWRLRDGGIPCRR